VREVLTGHASKTRGSGQSGVACQPTSRLQQQANTGYAPREEGDDLHGLGRLSAGPGGKLSANAEAADDPVIKQEHFELAVVCEQVANSIEDRLPGG
jgi:hypothetical protein